MPLRETVCGLPDALSVTEIEPFKLPEPPGVKVTVMVQFAPGARVTPQLSDCAKFALAAMLVMLSVAVPELVSVVDRVWLGVPTSWMPKVKLVGEKETFGDPLTPRQPPIKQDAKSRTGMCFFTTASSTSGRGLGAESENSRSVPLTGLLSRRTNRLRRHRSVGKNELLTLTGVYTH